MPTPKLADSSKRPEGDEDGHTTADEYRLEQHEAAAGMASVEGEPA